MRTLKANQFPYFLSLSLTGEGYRPAWLVANCMSVWERNYV